MSVRGGIDVARGLGMEMALQWWRGSSWAGSAWWGRRGRFHGSASLVLIRRARSWHQESVSLPCGVGVIGLGQ
eukprot:1624211-Alexandrium_andersonii.AAC.1